MSQKKKRNDKYYFNCYHTENTVQKVRPKLYISKFQDFESNVRNGLQTAETYKAPK